MSKILIADDASFMRLTIRQILSGQRDLEFIEAENGEIALEKYQVHRPDLTFLDITMPVQDGFFALSGILAINPDAKVIMCTALCQENIIQNALKIGAVDFIIKPFRHHQLIEMVKKHLA